MRDIVEVIERIKKEIPVDFPKDFIHNDLDKIASDSIYKAPEIISDSWTDLAFLLENTLKYPDTEWKQKIQLIMSGKQG